MHRQRIVCRQKGGDKTGPNPTSWCEHGTKRHLVTDRNGIPLAFVLTGANINDGIPPIGGKTGRPRPAPRRPQRRQGVRPSALPESLPPSWHRPHIARHGVETSQKLDRHRWVIERTFAWIDRYRRLVTRYECRSDIHRAFITLACAIICFNTLQDGF